MDPAPTSLETSEQDVASPPSPLSSPLADEALVARSTEEASFAVSEAPPGHDYPSLYDTKDTTMVAILLGVVIIVSIQIGVARIFKLYREEHRALTAFATSMVGIVVGIYVCDMLIAGPTAELLSEGERLSILSFVKDTALMVFAYYFGTKAQVPTDLPRE
jgi:nitrate/nitrite transporter NarK